MDELQERISKLSEEEKDCLFTMVCAEAFGVSPFAMEDYLSEKGIVKKKKSIWD